MFHTDDVVTELLELASSAESGEAHDVMSSEHSSTEKEMEGDGSEGSEESASSFSDMISFNLALLPPQGTFQKLRGEFQIKSFQSIKRFNQLNDREQSL